MDRSLYGSMDPLGAHLLHRIRPNDRNVCRAVRTMECAVAGKVRTLVDSMKRNCKVEVAMFGN